MIHAVDAITIIFSIFNSSRLDGAFIRRRTATGSATRFTVWRRHLRLPDRDSFHRYSAADNRTGSGRLSSRIRQSGPLIDIVAAHAGIPRYQQLIMLPLEQQPANLRQHQPVPRIVLSRNEIVQLLGHCIPAGFH